MTYKNASESAVGTVPDSKNFLTNKISFLLLRNYVIACISMLNSYRYLITFPIYRIGLSLTTDQLKYVIHKLFNYVTRSVVSKYD
jgi:hypothetical protein